jgi:hypothetical protein
MTAPRTVQHTLSAAYLLNVSPCGILSWHSCSSACAGPAGPHMTLCCLLCDTTQCWHGLVLDHGRFAHSHCLSCVTQPVCVQRLHHLNRAIGLQRSTVGRDPRFDVMSLIRDEVRHQHSHSWTRPSFLLSSCRCCSCKLARVCGGMHTASLHFVQRILFCIADARQTECRLSDSLSISCIITSVCPGLTRHPVHMWACAGVPQPTGGCAAAGRAAA